MSKYIDVMDCETESLDVLEHTETCPDCGALVTDGGVEFCLGDSTNCSNDQTDEYSMYSHNPLNFND
ncbi:hypothetical protein [Zhongshania sp.]|uniref:hypothetical protein n=1 Tax=Zhongshania sp. TaxID=1971902 RepID=UPI00356240EE